MKRHALMVATLAAVSGQAYAEDTEEKKAFTLDGEFGLIATTGNTDTTSMKGKLSANHELDKWSNQYLIEALYNQDQVILADGTEENQTTAQKFFVSGQGNYKLENPDNRLFVFGSYEDDRFSSFKYQSTIAGGWNQKVWDDEDSSFEYSVGPGYTYGETIADERIVGLIARTSATYQWKISETATFRQFLSTEVGGDNVKSKSETSLSAQINGSLSMKFSIVMDHNTEVEPGIERLDTQTAVTLVYTFL